MGRRSKNHLFEGVKVVDTAYYRERKNLQKEQSFF